MIQISAKHRIVGVPITPTLQGLFPGAKSAQWEGQPHLLIPHGFRETKMLRQLGHEVPAPIITQYDFPHPPGQPPFQAQLHTTGLMTTEQRAYVLNEMGTGKSRCALWAFDYLRKAGLAKRMLVVAPVSTLGPTWGREAMELTPWLTQGILYGTREKRLKRLAEGADILFINHDGLKVIKPELQTLIDAGAIDCVVIDELAVFRNGRSERNKLARKLFAKARWLWGMTGAPTPNDPTDAWGQCQIITPQSVQKFFTRFREETMLRVTSFKWVPKRDAYNTVFKCMQPAVRYKLDDIIELPQCIEREVEIELGPKQKTIYDTMRQHAYAMVQAKEITAVNAGAVLNKLLQISLGYVYDSKRGVVHLDNDTRLDGLLDILNSTQRKALVFVPYTHALAGIGAALKKEGIEHALVSGATPQGERDRIFTAFQHTNKYRVIAAHPVCMSHGLTLTAADTIVWFGPTTSLDTFDQANARIRRVGQKHKQQILMLWGSPAERQIYNRLRAKQKIQDNLLDLFAANSPE